MAQQSLLLNFITTTAITTITTDTTKAGAKQAKAREVSAAQLTRALQMIQVLAWRLTKFDRWTLL